MDSLIFVALALAWGAYLLPKAIAHHDAGARARTVSTFSERLRVLARREAVSRRSSALVTPKAAERTPSETPGPVVDLQDRRPVEVVVEASGESILETTQSGRLHLPSERPAGRRPSSLTPAAEAARRRRRVLGVLVFLFAATAAVAAGQVVTWWALVAPALLIAGWLVMCRMMVRGERRQPMARRPRAQADAPQHQSHATSRVTRTVTVSESVSTFADDDTASIPAVDEIVLDETGVHVLRGADSGTWEPVQAPLPTYVSKDVAPRRAITIDLDSTGVWTSGNTEADSALAREADAARAQAEPAPIKRASGA